MKTIFGRAIETIEEGIARINGTGKYQRLKACEKCGDYCNLCTRTRQCCLGKRSANLGLPTNTPELTPTIHTNGEAEGDTSEYFGGSAEDGVSHATDPR